MDELLDEKDTQQIKIKAPSEKIVFIDMICKSYEGLCEVNVSSDEEGVMYLNVTRGTRKDVLNILKDLQHNFDLKIVEK